LGCCWAPRSQGNSYLVYVWSERKKWGRIDVRVVPSLRPVPLRGVTEGAAHMNNLKHTKLEIMGQKKKRGKWGD